MFKSRLNRPATISSPIGNGERSIFEERIVNGKKRLVVTGKENLKDFIESSKQETLISNIIKRFERGDINVLSKTQGFYGDVTGMPSNLAEAQKLLINLENRFYSFSPEYRSKFDNSFDKFVRDVSSYTVEEFNSFFGVNLTTTVSESEVDVNE